MRLPFGRIQLLDSEFHVGTWHAPRDIRRSNQTGCRC